MTDAEPAPSRKAHFQVKYLVRSSAMAITSSLALVGYVAMLFIIA